MCTGIYLLCGYMGVMVNDVIHHSPLHHPFGVSVSSH